MEAGFFEVACFVAFLCWIFSERVLSMVDVVTARVQRTALKLMDGGSSEPGGLGEMGLRRASQRQQRQRRQRDANDNELLRREQENKQYRLQQLLSMKEKPFQAPLPADMRANNASLGRACERCTPHSRKSWVDARNNRSHVIHILDIGRESAASSGFFSRQFCDIVQAYGFINHDYPQGAPNTVMRDERVQLAIEQTIQEEVAKIENDSDNKSMTITTIRQHVEKRAQDFIENMKPMVSNFYLRIASWLMHKILPRIAPGGTAVRAEAISRLRSVASGVGSSAPLVFIPLHRSHLDYILVTLVLCNCGVKSPLVVGGENLKIPFFGWALRNLGAFFIRRKVDGSVRNQRDHVYRAALKTFLMHSLQANNNIEFFIEGGRTRSGKPQMPRGGILSVIMDAYSDGVIEDAMLVPVSINYDKLVDGNFTREQMGMPKKMENFWAAVKALWHMFRSNYGSIRVDFNQPYSLRELVRSFQQNNYHRGYLNPVLETSLLGSLEQMEIVTMQQLSHQRQISAAQSCSSLLGDEMSEEYLGLVEAIAKHVVYDASKATAIMSTNVVCWCLLTQFRKGCLLEELVTAVEKLCGRLLSDGRDLGFTGETVDVVNHAIDLLGPGLVKKEKDSNVIRVQPMSLLPNVIELSYYSNCILPHYALQAIVVTASEVLTRSSKTISQSSLIAESLCLCEVMSQEFLLAPPCRRLNDCVIDAIDELVQKDLLQSLNTNSRTGNLWSLKTSFDLEMNDEDDNPSNNYVDKIYTLVDTPEVQTERNYLITSLQPLIEAYVVTSYWLTHSDLVKQSNDKSNCITEMKFVQNIIQEMTTSLEQGNLAYSDAVSTEAINNCLRLHRLWGVVDLTVCGKDRMVTLNENFHSAHRLRSVYGLISKFKLGERVVPPV